MVVCGVTGAGLYYEGVRTAVGGSDNTVCAYVLADLQQTQDAEFEELLGGLHMKVLNTAL